MTPADSANAIAAACFCMAGVGAAVLLYDYHASRYKGPVIDKRARRRHKFTIGPRASNICSVCSLELDVGNHPAMPCKCAYRVAGDRCVCTRRRDRFTEPGCVWCRDGHHLTETTPAAP